MVEDRAMMAKESIPAAMAVSGSAMTWSPSMIVSLLGLVIGAAGVVIGYFQIRQRELDRKEAALLRGEKSRSNDIEERKLALEIENAKSKNGS